MKKSYIYIRCTQVFLLYITKKSWSKSIKLGYDTKESQLKFENTFFLKTTRLSWNLAV